MSAGPKWWDALKVRLRQGPFSRELVAARDRLQAELAALQKIQTWVPPGHFYSPIPSEAELRSDEARLFAPPLAELPGLDMRAEAQLALVDALAPWYAEMPFTAEPTEGLRYYYNNPAYSYSDAIFLHCMIRHLRPARIIEVGSGFSSCMTLDTNDLFFEGGIETTFIEPYPALLKSLMRASDRSRCRILEQRLQDVPAEEFVQLRANDILFVDSTHVSRTGSDVNRLLFEILPALAPGVHIHFHDIFYPFEYPRPWVFEGRAWNEAYALRAFLSYNNAFRIVAMNTYLAHFHAPRLREKLPMCLLNPGGSLWIERL